VRRRAVGSPAWLVAGLLLPGLVATGCASPSRGGRTPPGNPTLVLAAPSGEKTFPVSDLTFVYFKRIFYKRHAPRSEEATGRRIDIEDRRKHCRCLRLEDWSTIKFGEIRQIELSYAGGETVAVLRVTLRDGSMQVLRADSLYGGKDSLAPRFFATVDGERREFPLILPADAGGWPEETLVRLLLIRPPPATGRRR